jgi:class 3 adenylate cyclase
MTTPFNAVQQPPATSGTGQTMLSVLFADVSGSTRIYETLGDILAKQMVDECLDLMRSVVGQYNGRVIKTIGDEVMCVLPTADMACVAASDMQLRILELPAQAGIKRAIRVGWHYGPVLEENGDVYGDTVNLAARMATLAKAMQIMTTRSSVEQMSPMLRASSRGIAALSVKGKGDQVDVCEIIWQDSEELTMTTPSILPNKQSSELELRSGEAVWHLQESGAALLLGRDVGCQVVVTDRMASRQHARIEHRQGKFMLTDLSTNGTFVTFEGESEISLRREEVMLRGTGRIAFGRSSSETVLHTVAFTVVNSPS